MFLTAGQEAPTMKRRQAVPVTWYFLAGLVCLSLGVVASASPVRAQQRIIKPDTISGDHAVAMLKQASLIYKMNSQSYTSSNPTLDRYYLSKFRQTEYLIDRLKRGFAVSLDDVDDALDSEDARRLGGYPSPIPYHQSL
jgi:hypothetical protein